MVPIDHEDVPMPTFRVVVGMAVRFRSLPTFVFVLMVLIVIVQMCVHQGGMIVLESQRIMGPPYQSR